MKLLVLTSEPVSADQLRDALPGDADPDRRRGDGGGAGAARQRAAVLAVRRRRGDRARRGGPAPRASSSSAPRACRPAADTGESDPEDAIEDVLKTFAADRILVFTHGGDEQRYREDVDTDALQSRFGVPVTQARV